MSRQKSTYNLPEFYDFGSLCQYLGIELFPHKDIHFKKIESKTDLYHIPTKPFKHRFYAVSLLLEGEGVFNSGFGNQKTKKTLFTSRLLIRLCLGISILMLHENMPSYLPKILLTSITNLQISFSNFPFFNSTKLFRSTNRRTLTALSQEQQNYRCHLSRFSSISTNY